MDRSSLGGGSETDRCCIAAAPTYGERERWRCPDITEEQYDKVENLFQLEIAESKTECLVALKVHKWDIERAASSLMDRRSSRV